MKADTSTFNAVKAALNGWADSYTQRDITRLLSGIAPDLDVVMYGTGADEKRIGLGDIRAQAERDWSQTDSAAFVFDNPMISAAGSVAWAVADCEFQVEVDGQAMAFPGRFTGIFEERDDRWLVVHAHFSLPAASQDEGDSVPR